MNILFFGNCITERCLRYRENRNYLSVSGRKKVLALSRTLADLGHCVDICSVSYSKRTHSAFVEQVSEKIRLIHAPTLGLMGKLSFFKRTVGTIYNLFWLFSRFRSYDVVLFWNYHIEFSLPALLGRRLFGMKAVMDYEDGLFLDKGYQGAFYRFWEKAVYRNADGFILVNERLRHRIDPHLPAGKPSVTVHGFVDGDLLNRYKNAETGAVKRVLFTGNFSGGFGFQELLGYVDGMPDDIRFDITGKASKQEVDELKEHLARRSNVHFHGFVDDRPFSEIVEKADAFILLNDAASAYNRTNFPSKFFDYLSRNKLILTTKNPLLAPYRDLENVVMISDFPAGIRRLREMTGNRRTDFRQIETLKRDTARRLSEFLDAIIVSARDASASGR